MFKSHQRVSNYVLAVFHGTHSHRTQCGTTSIQTGLCLSLAVGISERYKAGNGSRNKENWLLLKLTSGSFFFCIFRELSSGLSDGRWWRHRAGHAKGGGATETDLGTVNKLNTLITSQIFYWKTSRWCNIIDASFLEISYNDIRSNYLH